ncbi:MAG: GTP-binding protein [Thermoplasmata archaeon]|nr:GTP-binding protein [Thermoplasmata archaeon]
MQKKIIKKICLLGDNSVGKTSLIKKYVFDTFDDKYIATIGTKTVKKELNIDYFGKPLNLTMMIWDIIGQKEYRNLQNMSFEGTSGALVVCDMTRPETLTSLTEYWVKALRDIAGNVPIIFMANKCDLVDEVKISREELMAMAKEYDANFFVTSAKTGENVEMAFKMLGKKVMAGKTDGGVDTKAREQKMSPAEVMDNIVAHFCRHSKQETDYAMSIIRKQCQVVGLDISNPSKHTMSQLIEKLAIVEADILSQFEVNKNRIERMGFLAKM